MTQELFAKCGGRCSRCRAYKANVKTYEDRQRCSDGWHKYLGVRLNLERWYCDGCQTPDEEQPTAGYGQKLDWLRQRFAEGMRLKIVYEGKRSVGFIEYLPGSSSGGLSTRQGTFSSTASGLWAGPRTRATVVACWTNALPRPGRPARTAWPRSPPAGCGWPTKRSSSRRALRS